MTRPDLNCIHEPFGDAFYFGPERLSERYADDEEARKLSGFQDATYATVVSRLRAEIEKVGNFRPPASFGECNGERESVGNGNEYSTAGNWVCGTSVS
jgi:hypothetical protein